MTVAVVILRDRATYAQQCVSALHRAGLDIVVFDHGSTWPPALDWLDSCGLPVARSGNAHPRDVWESGRLAPYVGSERFVLTDPDVIAPDTDWLPRLHDLLDRYPTRVKAGLALRLDDLPGCNRDTVKVRAWEHQWWQTEVEPGVYDALVDTTLALYRPLSELPRTFLLGPALRLADVHSARHLTWYEDTINPGEEITYYRTHVTPGVSHWADPDLYMGVK
ncbi:MAG TPA: hypothetical protein VHA75_03095 [Rugosimonospora sp.]|nr:hypothetical protein [Rugosimonospora sp.]